jgi:hypothetical protein
MLRYLLLLLCAAVLLPACDQTALFDSIVPKEESRIAQDLVNKIATRDYPAIEAALDPALRTPDLHARLEEMTKSLPTGSPKSARVVGSNTLSKTAATTYHFTIEYEYPNSWLLAAVLLERREGKLVLQGINFVPRTQAMAAENRFTLEGKKPIHYVVIVMAVAIPLFILYALVVCVRTKMQKRKWLWVLFVAVSVVQFHFNWTSGEWNVQFLSFMLLGAGFAKAGPVAPWVFTLAFPLGAILFLYRRQSLQHNEA